MRFVFPAVLLACCTQWCSGQSHALSGRFAADPETRCEVIIRADSSFYYSSALHPTFSRWEDFSEQGRWTYHGDTIILNPQLSLKPFVEPVFTEQRGDSNSSQLLLTFNHIKRYYDSNGVISRIDTVPIQRLDFAFNAWRKRRLTRVTPLRSGRCTFAGYIPKELITSEHTIAFARPVGPLRSIFVGCYELQGIKEFIITDPAAGHLTLNIYSNYYQDGQLRQQRLLLRHGDRLYTKEGRTGILLRRQKA